MKCVNHPDIDASDACTKCGCGVCAKCKLDLAGKTYCQVCIDVYGQLQPEALLAVCVNVLNVDGVSVCNKCGQRISDDNKQERHGKIFCQLCAREIIRDEANVAFFLAEMERRKTSGTPAPRKKKVKFKPYKLILLFLPINPIIIICGEILDSLFNFIRRFSSFNRDQEP